jgi:hypothetical protein
MKKYFLLFSIILLSIYSYGQEWNSIKSDFPSPISQKLISSNENQIVMQFNLSGFYTNTVETPRGKSVILNVPKMVSLSEVGSPDVPKFAVSAIIGDRADMDVRVISSEFTDFNDIDIAPSKGDFSRKIDPSTVPYTYGEIYNKNAFYPESPTALQEPYILRNFRGQALTIMPFVYNPQTKTLRVYHEIVVEMFKSGIGGENQFIRTGPSIKEDPEFSHIYNHHFINFQEAQNRYPILEEQGNLLIISHGPYMESMQPFVEWKKTIGRPTQIVNISDVGTTPQAIKDYVTNYYNTNGLTHLLLVGDHQHVPSFNNTASGGYSDNYYGYLSGNDSYNELFVGRISAETTTHVETQVQKIITYERDLDANDDWLSIGTGVARNEGAGNGHNGGEADYVHMDYIRDSLLNFTYTTVHREYDGGVPGMPNTTAAQISQRINAGTSVINYCNHGSQNSWSVANYSTSHVDALTNTDRWPIVWAVACDNGRFTNGSCFAETWMRATHNGQPTGAIGTMMSWISQPWQPPMTGQDEMVTILVEGYQNNIKRTFGGTSINGSMKMVDLHGASGKSTHDTWILFGDPTLTLRTATPMPVTVSHLPAIFLGMSEFTVNADAEGALVALTIDGEIIGSGTISNGSALITFPALNNVGTLKIAVFGFNTITYIQEIDIIPASGPFMAYVSSTVNGASISQVHYSQDVSLGVQVKNLGVEPASNVIATITTSSPYVTLITSSASYGTIQPDEVMMVNDAFSFTVSDDVPNNTPISFNLTMAGDEATWEATFNLTALAPAFSIGNFSISDASGNGNGMLDPGETVDLFVNFSNAGLSDANDITALLTFNSPYITVNQGTFETNEVAAGESTSAVFNISVSGGTPIGQAVEFSFSVAAGAYQAEKSFASKIGLIIDDFETGDFTAYPYTFAGNLPWVITNVNPYEGVFSAKSGTITHSQSSQMILQYEVSNNDSISFYRKVSSESGYDYMRFYIDNVKVGEWAGNIAWSKVAYPVTAGSRTFKWEYMKDFTVSSGDDCAWVDYITLPPALTTNGWAGNSATICEGETHQLDGTATHYNTLGWTTSGTGTFSNPAILNPVYTPSEADITSGIVVLKLTVTGNSATVESTKTLTINQMPEIFAGDDGFICVGNEFELNLATAANYSSLLWMSTGTGSFNDANTLNPIYTPDSLDYASGQVQLELIATGMGTCPEVSSTIVLNFHSLPTAVLSGDQTICHGQNAEITLTLSGSAPWTIEMADGMGSHTIPTSPFTMSMSPGEAITYTLLNVSDANGCINEAEGQAQILMNFSPIAPLKPAAPDTIDHAFVSSSNLQIDAVANADSYVWQLSPAEAGTISSNGTEATINWNNQFLGLAQVEVAAVNGCGQSDWSQKSEIVVRSTVGVNEQNLQNLRIYPNPSNGRFILTIDQLKNQKVHISVNNLIGELVYSETAQANAGAISREIALEHLPNGVYMITVENEKSFAVQRITIRK